jgi:hypothetical protein
VNRRPSPALVFPDVVDLALPPHRLHLLSLNLQPRSSLTAETFSMLPYPPAVCEPVRCTPAKG